MVVSMAFITGFKYEIRQKLFSFWGHVHVTEFNPNASNLIAAAPIHLDPELLSTLRKIPHVRQVSAYAVRPAILQANGSMEGIKLKGITSDYKRSSRVDFKGSAIDFSDTSYSKEILLSEVTAARLNLQPGDELKLYFLEPGASAPRIRKVKLSGLFHTGMDEVDREFGVCDIRLLQRINNWSASDINGYQLDLDDASLSDTVANLAYERYLQPPLTANTMAEIYPNIFDWLQLQDINARIVLIIMALVAIINLAVALLILIVEQARTVGLLKALGMQQGDIRQVFLSHSVFIAAAGILLGTAIGVAMCFLQQQTGFLRLSEATYYMSQVPVRINWWYVLLIDLSTLVICILCMWLPSLYIRYIQPARVLQFK